MVSIHLKDVSANYLVYGASSKTKSVGVQTVGAEIRSKGRFLEIQALKGISLDLKKGDKVGLVGINGSGKSTLLKVLAKCLSISSGTIEIEGSLCPQFSLASGMRQPLSGRGNSVLKCLYHGVPMRKINQHVEQIKELAGLGEYFEMPVRTYSAGMRSRLAMSLMSIMSGDIVIMDEWISAADATINEIASKLQTNLLSSAEILVMASHSERVLKDWTDRVIWLDHGKIMEDGPIDDVLKSYREFVRSKAK